MNPKYHPDDYDIRGQLKLPAAFWLILLLQARTWILFVMAGASRQQGAALLELFYPDQQAFWIGLGLGVPAALGLVLTGYRQRFPRLWQRWRWMLCLTLLATLAQQGLMLWQGNEALSPPGVLFTLMDLAGLIYLTFGRRIGDCFDPALSAG
ncbi:DUF2919 domain-containing protein [Erwinia psidii]|uniref:DUF2919 domain-containing protein n=1 Tax=Erwinia psidii TaxID=69224 RepID=A0A3N6S340_9GAMM|nr:DUF2919 domain-containing protein [Erwinia psidii]MCX8956722.1 DUF2919 domain-containing protein [Erwinia psidii]MCX8960467.1 DUF2919 domain-containing protein [Erwinia psidii]MCX8964350.1 DUF2919 domain-containing protein [Erwinia psidii]RQM40048.1 DUF2919 domain-containing protein [Erwinia psidii]